MPGLMFKVKHVITVIISLFFVVRRSNIFNIDKFLEFYVSQAKLLFISQFRVFGKPYLSLIYRFRTHVL